MSHLFRRVRTNRRRVRKTSCRIAPRFGGGSGRNANNQSCAGRRKEAADRRARRVRSRRARLLTPARSQPGERRSTARLQFCRRTYFHRRPRREIGSVDSAGAGWSKWRIYSYMEARSAPGVEPGALRLDSSRRAQLQRHLCEKSSALFCPPYIYYSVTATAQFEGSRCIISINDPLAAESVRVDGRSYPLAANFTASYAMLLAREKPQKLGFARLLRPQEYAATARVARLEPYNPNKTVLLVIHGLMDTPVTWVPMVNDFRGDPDFRRNYQVWFYSYPSGYPYPYCATILRKELDAIEKKYPLRKPMIVVAHSMGGCITRTLLTDAGNTLWLEAFGHPPAQTPMDPQSKRLLEEVLIFNHRRDIGRVVFMSTPHRGATLASNWIGRIGSMLVRTPSRLLTVGRTLRESATADPSALKLKRLPNSVDTLAPNSRFVVAINKIPITKGIPYHSIIGDRGRGDSPNSSDGVVPYWSSHLDGARSERIVPSGHGSPLNPQAIAEVHRILQLNAQSH